MTVNLNALVNDVSVNQVSELQNAREERIEQNNRAPKDEFILMQATDKLTLQVREKNELTCNPILNKGCQAV